MMLHIPDVLTRQQVTAIRTAIDAADWVDGRATAGSQGARVKRNRQLPEDSPVALEQGRIIEQALAANALYFSAALPARTMSPLFNRYADSETYGLHVDGAARRLSGAQQWMRTDVSCTLFLCDPEDYDGGELVVVDTYGTHEVKLPAGDLILYPSTSLHRVEPVTRGERVCSFFWAQSMVRDDTRRAMLFEMDQTIQRLREKLGETDETLSLAGQYHNLLRMWAET
ncbi:Fe2+-dependent dioxygenase [Delftia sp. HK171]|uniref:Fe2+-dependent dioxygenase n=2 Tax=Pseudomonadati TaxID=3379134 RepID=A0AAJ2V7L0_DELAC|nr:MULTISPECIES: Fe2+-dependent dioxygenase [Delftia]APE47513.1 Fe2+-dependent dioxygenase [Delftia sp. HK171]MCG8989503.1 Fe2+-dependent dioxygenase [Delftia acidovorans]MDX4952365.1 Fe2+-dependent dioxygenase [Delftia acidovorans]PJO39007.1 Fe2+-dependent dioxygenase [Delftia acidovorans]